MLYGHKCTFLTYLLTYYCAQVVYQQFISNLSVLIHNTLTPVPCQLVDQAGVYHAVVRWSRDPTQTGTGSSSTVAVSGEMAASWSDAYNLSTSAISVFPCEENSHLTVDFTQPACAGDHDKVNCSILPV